MKLAELPGAHLSYCTNVHAGESWADVEKVLEGPVCEVKRLLGADGAFGVGLRLAARAAHELEAPGELERARELLRDRDLYVFTLNGFPYGSFHGTRVKERVYQPDWLEEARIAYTASLARVLAALLPEGVSGSISTVPGCFAERARGPAAARTMARNVVRATAELVKIGRQSGRRIALALEPEPACFLETSSDTVAFFEEHIWSRECIELFGELLALDPRAAEATLREQIGVCLDTCHASVEFETPLGALRRLRGAGIAIPKIQLSAGLRVAEPDAAAFTALADFADDTYLHQVVVAQNSSHLGSASSLGAAPKLRRFLDLPAALAEREVLGGEWRVHFHVPVFEKRFGPLGSTQEDLADLLLSAEVAELTTHLEVETYSFGVLPAAYRNVPLTEAIARELRWTLLALSARPHA
jgi:sugar phosphate isomerase/epimerase